MSLDEPRTEARLARYALGHPTTVVVLFLAAIVVGFVAMRAIAIELIPRGFEIAYLSVIVPWGEAPAEEVLDKITLPLEEELSTVKALDRITSSSSAGQAVLLLAFKPTADMKVAYREARDRVERARRLLPDDADRILVKSEDPAGLPAYVVAVVIDPEISDPYALIERDIVMPISRVPGVASVSASGHLEKEIAIELDRTSTEAAGLDIYRVTRLLADDNFTLASGDVEEGGRKLLVRSVARYDSLDDIRAIKVTPTTRIDDIGTVRLLFPEQQSRTRAMNRPAVTLTVLKEGDANGRDVASLVAAEIERLKREPRLRGFEMIRLFDQSEVIDETLSTLFTGGLIGSGIAVAVLLFFLRRIRMTLLVAASIPLSLLLALTAMYFLGETLNLLSLLGLMICVGLLVDNSVVVAENIHRKWRGGASRRDAVVLGAGQITLAITMSTLTTVIVFVSVFLIEGTERFFLVRLAIPVSVSLLASLVVALGLVPLGVYAALPRRRGPDDASPRRGPLERVLTRAYDVSFGVASRAYEAMLRHFLAHRVQLVALVLILVVVSVAVLAAGGVGFVRIQRYQQAGFDFSIDFPEGITFRDAELWFERTEAVLERERERLGIEGWTVQFKRSSGELRGWFRPAGEMARSARQAAAELRGLLPEMPGLRIYTSGDTKVMRDLGPQFYQLTLYGEDPRLLDITARSVEDALSRVPGVIGVRRSGVDRPNELGLVMDRARLRRYGASPQVVAGLVSYALRGSALPKFSRDGREIPVRIRYSRDDRKSLDQLQSFRVPTESGGTLSVGTLTDTRVLTAPLEILRDDKRVARTITLELAEGREDRTRRLLGGLVAGAELPEGISFTADVGQARLRRELADLAVTVVIAVIFIYLIMGFLFESFTLPLSILLTIPLALVGVVGLHWVVRRDIDVLGAVGFVLLAGVVVNNGIVLVDYLNRLRRRGLPRDEATVLATRRRFRPIVMTAITTIGGLVPLALTGTTQIGISYASFALTLIGGMTAATVLTLLVVPVFYSLIDDARDAATRAVRRGERISQRLASG